MEAAATHAHSKRAVLDFMPEYRKMIACDGIAVWSEEELRSMARHRGKTRSRIS